MTVLREIVSAARNVLTRRNYLALFAGVSAFFALVYFLYPVYATPGNSIEFQLELMPWWGFALIALLALLVGLVMAMQVYVFRHASRLPASEATGTVVAGATGFIANAFASATCASCVAALFSFLGVGGVLFLLNYRWQIMGISFAVMLVSLYLVSKRVNGNCMDCEAKP